MIKSSITDVSPFRDVPTHNSPTTYSNNSFGVEQLLIQGGEALELVVSDGVGGAITLHNTRAVLLRPFASVTITYMTPPTAVKVMVL